MEGSWEEIVSHSDELAGRHVRLVVLSDEAGERSTPFYSRSDPVFIPATPGAQPVLSLDDFMASLPDVGEDAEALARAIEESRAERRAAVR